MASTSISTFGRSVTLFFPAFNERESVMYMTHKAYAVMKSITDDFEILIIDDGSTDGTAELSDQLEQQYPEVRVIHHQGNQGYGQALHTGFANASKDAVVYTD